MPYDHIAVHEAAHAVFLIMFGIRPQLTSVYKNPVHDKMGIVIPAYNERYNILLCDQETYNKPTIQSKIINETRVRLLSAIAGNCAEKYFLQKHPDYPPDMRIEADGHQCHMFIQKLCEFHFGSFSEIMFNQLYFNLMNLVYYKIKSDNHLFDLITIIAEELSKRGNLKFGTVFIISQYHLIKKVLFDKYRPYPFLEIDLIAELENRNLKVL